MTAWLWVACVLVLLGPACPAAAQGQRRNPCDHYAPTGEALPRKDQVRGNVAVHEEPSNYGHSVGTAHSGDVVEVLKECGREIMIRTPEGIEGWVSLYSLPHEEVLARTAASRPFSSEEDCELRLENFRQVETCKADVARKKAHDDEVKNSVFLNPEQVRSFVFGKTVTYTVHPMDGQQTASPAAAEPQATIYYADDGEAFVKIGTGNGVWRGRWQVRSDNICLPTSPIGCGRLRRSPSGDVVWVGRTGEYTGTPQDGDAKGIVALVSGVFPYPAPRPVPKGLEAVAHPVMGW